MASPSEVKKALMTVMPLFSNFKPPATDTEVRAFTEAWHRQVGHLDADLLVTALADAAGKTGFFPTPKEVMDSVASITAPKLMSGEEAWGRVLKAVGEFGYLHPPGDGWTFKDPSTLAVVTQIGWSRICLEEDETLQWQFIHAYKALTEREITAVRELPVVADTRRQIEARRETARVMAALQAPTSKNGLSAAP